jgi:RNA polymerase sigma factor (sigma-70 family)
MSTDLRSDEELLLSTTAEDFGLFYDRHVDSILWWFARRAGNPDAAADLTAETFAAALAARGRFRRRETVAAAWLFGIAHHKLADYHRHGAAQQRMCRRLGIALPPLDADDREMVGVLGRDAAGSLLAALPPDQRDAVRAHVFDGEPYDVIASQAHTTEATIAPRARPVPRHGLLRAGVALAAAAACAAAIAVAVRPDAPDETPVGAPPPRLEGRPLFGGTLQAGVRYRTTRLVPAVSFVVPDDHWYVERSDLSDAVGLEYRPAGPGNARPPGQLLSFMRLPVVVDPASGEVVPAPEDIVGWLRDNLGLRAGEPRRTTLLGRPARQLDVTVVANPRWEDPTCRPRFELPCLRLAPNAQPFAGEAIRFLVLDHGGRHRLVVAIESVDARRQPEILRAAEPILASAEVATSP